MTDIPEDVMSIARGCICIKETAPGKAPLTARRIALAILAERERCANLAIKVDSTCGGPSPDWIAGYRSAGIDICRAIRGPLTPELIFPSSTKRNERRLSDDQAAELIYSMERRPS